MNRIFSILLGFIGLIVLTNIIWRFASRYASIPCPTWLQWMVERDNPFAKGCRASFITEHLDLKPGMTVLDAGCGPGRVTIPLAQKIGSSGHVVALDIQQGMLDTVARKAKAAHLTNIEFINAGLGQGTLKPNQFDRATLVSVLGEVPDQQAALKELFQALKPGGVLSVSETVFDPHYQSREKVLQIAKVIGFREGKMFGNWFAYTLHVQKPS